MPSIDTEWHRLMLAALGGEGELHKSRAGPAHSLFGAHAALENSASFPAVTTKRLFFETAKRELACYLRGYTHVSEFHDMGVHTWDKNALADGALGPIYGAQWVNWRARGQGINQLANVVSELQLDPESRRLLVSAWNVGELPAMCLPPCPVLFQVSRRRGGLLDMAVFQRSCDLFLGFPFDAAQHALLQRLIAKEADLEPGRLHFFFGDAHVYENHREQAEVAVGREPFRPPTLRLHEDAALETFMPHEAELVGYEHHSELRGVLN